MTNLHFTIIDWNFDEIKVLKDYKTLIFASSRHYRLSKISGLIIIIIIIISFLFLISWFCISFFKTYLFYLVCSPRLGSQKHSCWRRLRHEDRWLWPRSRYLQEWIICADEQWCFANEVDGDRIIVFEGVLREKWCVSTNNIKNVWSENTKILCEDDNYTSA